MIVNVVWATLLVQDLVPVELPPGATVADAVKGSGLVAQHGLDLTALRFARFGSRVEPDTRLADGDRVEIVRGLVADPKAARIRRARAGRPPLATPRNIRRTG